MSAQSTTPCQDSTPEMRPWQVDVNPDFFGVHLFVDGRRFFIPKERLEAVIKALSVYQEKPPIADWLDHGSEQESSDQVTAAGQQSE